MLEEAGLALVPYRTVTRRLRVFARAAWRQQISAACAARARPGPASLVLYDCSTLYFETNAGDGFRESGFSEERRLEPQLIPKGQNLTQRSMEHFHSWGVADEDALQPKAAKLALDRARQIAQQMAAGLSATLGPLVYASNEAPARGPQPFMRAEGMMAAAPMAKAVEPLSVSAPKVTASATVYAVFSIQ